MKQKVLNFISENKNDVSPRKEIYSINDILLSKNNPRFTLLESFDNDLTNIIIKDTTNETDIQTFKNLIFMEGDLSDLYKLVENIDHFGFINPSEPLVLVYNDELKKYVVAEGNRRVLVLKTIFEEKYEIPSVEEIIENSKGYDDTNSNELIDREIDFDEADYKKTKEKITSNYNAIISLIEKIKSKTINWDVYYTIISDSKILWSQIYDKHLTGERPGMRKWSRSKYFADLLSVFPDGISESYDENRQIFKNINREKTKLINDFKSAQFVYLCFYYSGEYSLLSESDYENINFKNLDILNALIHSSRISALEPNHSYSKIKQFLIKDIFKVEKNDFSRNYFNLKFNKSNNRIEFDDKKIPKEKLLFFIFENWKNGKITTRPFKEEDKLSILSQLKLIVNNININKKMDIDEFERLEEFSLSIEELTEIYNNQKIYYGDSREIRRIRKTIDIKNMNNEIIRVISNDKVLEKINKDDPLNVFNILMNQLKHNSKPDHTYLNAIFCSIRSFFEQFIVWSKYFSMDTTNLNDVNDYINNIATSRIHELFSKQRDKLKNNLISISKYTKVFRKDISQEDIEYISTSLERLLDDENWNNIINENIHASHRIYISSYYDNKIVAFSEFLKLMETIIKNMDFNSILELNEKVKKKIINEKNENNRQ